MSDREPTMNHHLIIDRTPLPKDIPQVDEVGATSSALYSAAYFIGARCKPYNDDFLQCKEEAQGTGEMDCLKEGRRVTRCASHVLQDINTHCADYFQLHFNCLNNNNNDYYPCRKAEKLLNKCVYDNLKLEKIIPDTYEQVHLKEKPQWTPGFVDIPSEKAYALAEKEGRI